MKTFLALALIAGVALGNLSTSPYAWQPNQEFLFKFETQHLTGIPSIKNQYAGLKLDSKVIVQTFDDFTLRLKFVDPKFIVVNDELIHGPSGRPQTPPATQELPSELRTPLTRAFLVHIKRGVVESLFVDRSEPVVVTNIKKALLSQLQMDLTGLRRSQVESNLLLNGNGIEEPVRPEEGISYFTTQESTLTGDCEMTYTIHPMSDYQVHDIEEQLTSEVKILRQEGQIQGEITSRGREICQGKKYFQITKVKNFDNCKTRPVYQTVMGIKSSCDSSKAECKDTMTSLSRTSYIVCGDSTTSFRIRKITTDNSVSTNPIQWNNTPEKIVSNGIVNLLLLEVKTSGFSPLPSPSDSKEKKSLIFEFPVSTHLSSESQEDLIHKIESSNPEAKDFVPIFPMPDMRSAPLSIMPRYMSVPELMNQISTEFEKVVRKLFESPESCSSRSDVSGTLAVIAQNLKQFSYEELKQLESQVMTKYSEEELRKLAKDLFVDMLSMGGTNPCVLRIKEKLQQGEITESLTRINVLQNVIRSVQTPTKEVFTTLFELIKSHSPSSGSSTEHNAFFSTGLVSLTNLINKACINPSTMTTSFPARIFGKFCSEESSFITEQYIPYLVSQLERSELTRPQRLIIISTLGKLGHKKTLLPLVKVIEGKIPTGSRLHPLTRSLAVYSLKRLAKTRPEIVKPILLTLIDNFSETPEVRIAAIATLPWCQPSTSDLQKIAVRSWFDPSKQVCAFTYSTLISLPRTEVPELKSVGLKARGVVSLCKPFQYGFQYSHNTHSNNFISYLNSVSTMETSYVNSKGSIVPTRMTFNAKQYGSSWELQGVSFTVYTEGMNALLDQLFVNLGYKSHISPEIRDMLKSITDKLSITPRAYQQTEKPELLMQLRLLDMETMFPLDKRIVSEMIQKVYDDIVLNPSVLLRGIGFSKTHALMATSSVYYGPSETGFPFMFSVNMPVVLGVKGNFKTESGLGTDVKVVGKIIPTVNGKIQSNYGIICPFTKQFIGSGVELSLHLSLPFTIEMQLNSNGQLKVKVGIPEEIRGQYEPMHVYVMPYTVTKSLTRLRPISKSSSVKKIVSGIPEKKIDMPFGQTLGLSAYLKINTDYPYFDFPELWNKLSYHNIGSLWNTLLTTTTCRYTSIQVTFNPRSSETKTWETNFNIVYGKKSVSGSPIMSYPKEIEVSQEMERQIESMCKYEHQYSSDVEKCVSKKMLTLEGGRLSHQKAKEILEKLNSQVGVSQVVGVHIDSSFNLESGHGHKTFQTVVLVGGQKTNDHTYKTLLHMLFKTESMPIYEIDFETRTVLPKIPFRWNIHSLINQNIQMEFDSQLTYGHKNQEKKQLTLKSIWTKSEELKRSILSSDEFKMCEKMLSKNMPLSSICEEVRHQASSTDKVWIRLSIPETWKRIPFFHKIETALQAYFFTQINIEEHRSGEGNTYELTSRFSRIGDTIQVHVKSPYVIYNLKDVRVPLTLRHVMPLSLRNGITLRVMQKASRDQDPASCRINPETITTFDNKTYGYQINECEHLIFKDCTSNDELTRPLAVLGRKTEGHKKIIKILSGSNIIELKPTGSEVTVELNKERITIPKGQSHIKRSTSSSDVVELIIFHSYDNVITVHNPIEDLRVFFDGEKVEVVAPQMLKHRSCGVCGDLNGESTADLKSPRMCLMSKPRFTGYSYMIQEGSCPGIPSQDRSQYESEKSQCAKMHYVVTPLEGIAKRLVKVVKPISQVHVIESLSNELCISKSLVKICPDGTKPQMLKTKVLRMTCLSKPTSKSHQLFQRLKSGQNVVVDLLDQPTTFTKRVFEPVKCVRSEGGQFWYHRSSSPRYL